MDFKDTAEEAAFRKEARAWLKANRLKKKEMAEMNGMDAAKTWQKRKYDAGWACLTWPEEYGGRGASPIENVIWNQEESKFDTPDSIFAIGQGMCAPTMMAWASSAISGKHLPAAFGSPLPARPMRRFSTTQGMVLIGWRCGWD